MSKGRGGGGSTEPGLAWGNVDQDITKWEGFQAGLNLVKAEQQAADSVSFYYDSNKKKFNSSKKETNLATYPTNKNAPDGVNIPYTVHIRPVNDDGTTYEIFGSGDTDDSGNPFYTTETRYVWVPFSEVAGASRDDIAGYLQARLGGEDWSESGSAKYDHGRAQSETIVNAYNESQNNKRENAAYAELNKRLAVIENQNKQTNEAYDKAEQIAYATQKGSYIDQRNALDALNTSSAVKNAVKDGFKDFYRDQKLERWDPALGARPAYGVFESDYYKENNPAAVQQWQAAVQNDDIDITERYGERGFYLQHYTSQGKPAGARGNKAEVLNQADAYTEKPTDADIQNARDLQLGINTGTQTDRLLNIPEINAQWEAAINGDAYWDKLAKEKYLDVNKPDEFAALFRLSDRPEDKNISFRYNANMGYGVTDLEDALNQAVGDKAMVDVKRFSALSQNVLQDTITEMKKQKAKESTLATLKGFSGVGEIMDMGKTLSESLLGDSGIGGTLAMMGSAGEKQKESLEKGIEGLTKTTNNNAIYNWQQWFDNALTEKYNKDLELGYSVGDAKEQVRIDKGFANDFITKYLKPRFDESRSMDEFVEYLDVRQEEQNPFQTQVMLNAVKQTADLRAKMYLDQIGSTGPRGFNAEFYFNPTGNKGREANGSYVNQRETVASDWDKAKNGDPYWVSQAYRYGIDVNNKDAFARMHFEVAGQHRNYDPAEDILNAGKVQDEINNNILPQLKGEALKQGTVFGIFKTPDEFADEMLKGLDPNDKKTWDESLKQFGMDTWKGTLDELKTYITSTIRSGTAADIRSKIKYLNEKRKDPTQEVLGITYIDRPEDFKNAPVRTDDALYKTFQKAGYKGSEDEFYEKFFPDTDPSELGILSKAAMNKPLEVTGFYSKDPWENLSKVSSLLGEDETEVTKTTSKSTKDDEDTNFFDLKLNDDEEDNSSSKTGRQVLGEFTSLFKGL